MISASIICRGPTCRLNISNCLLIYCKSCSARLLPWKEKKRKEPPPPTTSIWKSLKWFQVNYFYPLSLFPPPLPSLRWKVWIFMSHLDTLIRWIMLHASRRRRHCRHCRHCRRRLSDRLITPSVSCSERSVTAAADNRVVTRPGRVTGQWGGEADRVRALWPPSTGESTDH